MLFLWVGVLCIICMFVAVCSSRCARILTLILKWQEVCCYVTTIVLNVFPIKLSPRWIAGKVAPRWLHVESGCFMKFIRYTAGVIFIQMMHFYWNEWYLKRFDWLLLVVSFYWVVVVDCFLFILENMFIVFYIGSHG